MAKATSNLIACVLAVSAALCLMIKTFRLNHGYNLRQVILEGDSSSRHSSTAVAIDVFVEALCIDCQGFVLDQLVPAYETLGAGVMNLNIISFGNSAFSGDDLTCQHGQAECDANSYQLCAADVYKGSPQRLLPFFACLFERLDMGHRDEPFNATIFASCGLGMDWNLVQACHDDPTRTLRLQHAADMATPDDHTSVPWVLMNDQYIDVDSGGDTLIRQVCEEFKRNGGVHPYCGGFKRQLDAPHF